jgi:hypothetical protein
MEAYRQRRPLRRLGKPEDVAGTSAFLASDDAAFIHDETIVIDGSPLTESPAKNRLSGLWANPRLHAHRLARCSRSAPAGGAGR